MRLEQLTFTRFIAAISIFVFHYGKNAFPFHLDSVKDLFSQSNVSVSYFFILSGFVMIIAYGNKNKIDFRNYIKRRFARIYPVYLLAIILVFLYLIIAGKSIDFYGLLANLFMVQSWFPGYALSLNTPGWSLAVELFFYLSFPLIFNQFYKKCSLQKTTILVLLFFIISQIILHVLFYSSFYEGYPSKGHDFIFYFPLMHLNEFIIGNLAGIFFIKGIKKRNYDWLIIVILICSVLLLKQNVGIIFHNGMLAFVFVPLILLIASNKGMLTRISNTKSLVFLGEISYGIYILQKPVYLYISSIFYYLKIDNLALVFYISLIVLIVCAAFSYKYIETPLRKKINNLNTKKGSINKQISSLN
ncbi:acyltransferase family protein [Lacinutrix cladophorae]